MEIGKLPNELLKELVLDKLIKKRPEVLVSAGIGEDCSSIDFGRDICVLSSDPITGTANDIGRLAVNISCNDIAASGAEPLGLLMTILVPPFVGKEELGYVVNQISEASAALNVDVIGGHTEVTDAVTRLVIITTAVGKVLRQKIVSTSGAQAGDDILITKTVGLEGTAIIAKERASELEPLIGKAAVQEAAGFINSVSVVREGLIAGKSGASAMHDVTEGGILGALWELAEASDCGLEVFREHIPVAEVTQKICNIFKINPLMLISSGCMLIASKNGKELQKILELSGISASIIGKVTGSKEKIIFENEKRHVIEAPGPDELYRVLSKL